MFANQSIEYYGSQKTRVCGLAIRPVPDPRYPDEPYVYVPVFNDAAASAEAKNIVSEVGLTMRDLSPITQTHLDEIGYPREKLPYLIYHAFLNELPANYLSSLLYGDPIHTYMLLNAEILTRYMFKCADEDERFDNFRYQLAALCKIRSFLDVERGIDNSTKSLGVHAAMDKYIVKFAKQSRYLSGEFVEDPKAFFGDDYGKPVCAATLMLIPYDFHILRDKLPAPDFPSFVCQVNASMLCRLFKNSELSVAEALGIIETIVLNIPAPEVNKAFLH